MPIDLYPNIAKIKRNGAYQNLPGFVQQSGDADIEAMIANKETSTTAQFPHAKDSFFILNDILYQADENIAINDTIAVGTNCHVEILGNEVFELTEEVASQSEKIDSAIDVVEPINKYSGAWSVDGYFMGNSFITAANYKTTKPIKLKAGNYLFNINVGAYGSAALTMWECDKDGNKISVITGTNTGIAPDYQLVSKIISFTLTHDTYVRTNIGASSAWEAEYIMCEGNSADDFPSEYVAPTTEEIKLNDSIKLTQTMETQVSGMINSAGKLYSKKISADGDSICYGNGYRGGYAKMISDKFSMPYQNIAVGGGTIASGTYVESTPRHWICRTVENLDTDADYILVEGGCNDASLNVTLGEITTGLSATLDDTTFYGAMETICKILTTKYVGKKYAFIITHGCTNGYYSGGDYYNAIVACCRKWGVPLIDLSKYVPPFNLFRGTDYDTIRGLYTTEGDGWHPTELCYEKYYVPIIESFMERL